MNIHAQTRNAKMYNTNRRNTVNKRKGVMIGTIVTEGSVLIFGRARCYIKIREIGHLF